MSDFLDRLRASPRRRMELREVLSAFMAANPELANLPQRNSLLLSQLMQHQEEGALTLPAAGSWDRRLSPAMPLFVTLARPVRATASRQEADAAHKAWAPELGFWPDLRPSQISDARKVSDWLLANTQTQLRVPLKERSLEIFGDEKRLDSLREGQTLFGGRLRLDTLRTFVVSPPLPYRVAQTTSRGILVVENHCSFWSFGEWNAHAGRWRAVVYGAGNGFAGAADSLMQVCSELGLLTSSGSLDSPGTPSASSPTADLQPPSPLRLEYLGDLDPKGVRIPLDFNLSMTSRGRRDLCVVPLLSAYRGLLARGTRRERPDLKGHPLDAQAWLGAELGAQLSAMWAAGHWIAQEALGFRQLVEQPERFLD